VFKRVIWTGTGMVVGAAGAFWAKHKVERTVEQYLPEQVAARVGTSTREMGRTVRAAATEGRDAMRATEAELRARVEARTFTGPERAPEPVQPAPSPVRPHSPRRASRVPGPEGSTTAARRRARR
jgi:hypothetical protein